MPSFGTLHPRNLIGRFVERGRSAPEISLGSLVERPNLNMALHAPLGSELTIDGKLYIKESVPIQGEPVLHEIYVSDSGEYLDLNVLNESSRTRGSTLRIAAE